MTEDERKHLYSIWNGMKQRCDNPNHASARYYHNKGVRVCDEWHESFIRFSRWAMSNGYKVGLTIDRIDSDGNYEPSNCEWVTRGENTLRKNMTTEAIRARIEASKPAPPPKRTDEEITANIIKLLPQCKRTTLECIEEITESQSVLTPDLTAQIATYVSGFMMGVSAARERGDKQC